MATFDLIGNGQTFEFGLCDWHCVLELAERNGWHPAGVIFSQSSVASQAPLGSYEKPISASFTEEKDFALARDEWLMTHYLANDGQTVTSDDAAAMADALKRALDDIPNYDAGAGKRDNKAAPLRMLRIEKDVDPAAAEELRRTMCTAVEWFSGEKKDELRQFIRFCRRGSFRIAEAP